MGRHHCEECGERDIIDSSECEKCGRGNDCDLCATCAERCCMPKGAKNRLYDTDLVKNLLQPYLPKVKTTSLAKVLAGWIKKHASGDDDSAHANDEDSEEASEDEEEDGDDDTTDGQGWTAREPIASESETESVGFTGPFKLNSSPSTTDDDAGSPMVAGRPSLVGTTSSPGSPAKRKAEDAGAAEKRPKDAAEFAADGGGTNEALAALFKELSAFEFKKKEMIKGVAYKKIAAVLREQSEKITSGSQAQQLPGIGKESGKKIDQFLASGEIERLEKYRRGEMD
jgi:hypothetical protein